MGLCPQLEDCVNIDPHKFGQVVRNLLSNALKFTRQVFFCYAARRPWVAVRPPSALAVLSSPLTTHSRSSSRVSAGGVQEGGTVTVRVRAVDSFSLYELVDTDEFKLFGKTSFWDMLNQVHTVPLKTTSQGHKKACTFCSASLTPVIS